MPDNNAYAMDRKQAMLERIDKFAKKKADDERNKAAKAARRTASAMASSSAGSPTGTPSITSRPSHRRLSPVE